jgi:hypothetical protein
MVPIPRPRARLSVVAAEDERTVATTLTALAVTLAQVGVVLGARTLFARRAALCRLG